MNRLHGWILSGACRHERCMDVTLFVVCRVHIVPIFPICSNIFWNFLYSAIFYYKKMFPICLK